MQILQIRRRGWLAISLLTGCSPSGSPGPSSPPPKPDGAAVYALACRRCHGDQGRGDGSLAHRVGPVPDLKPGRPAALIRTTVLNGRGAMPAHRNRLTPAQIDAVVDYVSRW